MLMKTFTFFFKYIVLFIDIGLIIGLLVATIVIFSLLIVVGYQIYKRRKARQTTIIVKRKKIKKPKVAEASEGSSEMRSSSYMHSEDSRVPSSAMKPVPSKILTSSVDTATEMKGKSAVRTENPPEKKRQWGERTKESHMAKQKVNESKVDKLLEPMRKGKEKKSEIKSHVKSHAKTSAKPEIKASVKPEVKPEVKSEIKSEIKPEVKSEMKPNVKSDVNPELPLPSKKIPEEEKPSPNHNTPYSGQIPLTKVKGKGFTMVSIIYAKIFSTLQIVVI